MDGSKTDAELVRDVLAGRRAAYAVLARRWAPRITALCHARVGSRPEVEDLAQESLLRGLGALGTLTEPAKFGAWLAGICHRVCLDWLKSRRRSEVQFSALPAHADPDELVTVDADEAVSERRDRIRRLMREVEALPDDYRVVLLLYYYNDMTYRDVAEILGVSAATVNARLTKARAMLRERLGVPASDGGSHEL